MITILSLITAHLIAFNATLENYPSQAEILAKIEFMQPATDTGDYLLYQSLKEKYCWKPSAKFDQNRFVLMASIISNNNKNFLALLNGENGLFQPLRWSKDGWAIGFCGIDKRWHKDIILNPLFKQPQWQLATCFNMWQNGVAFYAPIRPNLSKFQCPK